MRQRDNFTFHTFKKSNKWFKHQNFTVCQKKIPEGTWKNVAGDRGQYQLKGFFTRQN